MGSTFGGDVVGPLGGGFGAEGGWETNTLVSDLTTVICLDDYHLNDREGRKVTQRTALDPAETIEPTPIIIFEGLHPMHDARVADLLDFTLYLDISDEVKLNWKIQRDMEERGHSLESILASIEARKPDFDAYIAPQKEFADLIIEVLPTDLDKEDKNTLKVRCIQKEGVADFNPCFIFDEGSTITWVPPADKLSSPAPGIKMESGPSEYYGKAVQI